MQSFFRGLNFLIWCQNWFLSQKIPSYRIRQLGIRQLSLMPDIRNEETVAATLPHCGNHTSTLWQPNCHTDTQPHCHTVASARPVGELDSVGLARQQNIFRHLKCWNDGMGIDLDRSMEINQALASKIILTRRSMTSLSLTLGAPGQVLKIKTYEP